MKVLYRGVIHLADDVGDGRVLVLCSRALLPRSQWAAAADEIEVACRRCAALGRRQKRG